MQGSILKRMTPTWHAAPSNMYVYPYNVIMNQRDVTVQTRLIVKFDLYK